MLGGEGSGEKEREGQHKSVFRTQTGAGATGREKEKVWTLTDAVCRLAVGYMY